MGKSVSFIHAADLHLDSPFKGLANIPAHLFHAVSESTFHALDRLVQSAIEKKVDFVLLVGDLFDNDVPGIKAQIKLRTAFETLKHHQINVYICYGNHDHLKGNVYQVEYPENVYIFQSEKIDHFTYKNNGEAIAQIYGFSYEHRAISKNKAKEYHIADREIPFHIAMLHGSYNENKEHATYAPFSIHDLAYHPFDYWALGHIHQRAVLKQDPPVVYPGNIQGRHRKEVGEKGCYYVRLTETDVSMNFIPLHSIEFRNLSINISNCSSITEIEDTVRSTLQSNSNSVPELISLTFIGTDLGMLNWDKELIFTELIELMNETFIHRTNWIYIYRYDKQIKHKINTWQLQEGEHFIGELTRQWENISIQSVLSELYNHKQAKRHLDMFEDSELESIKEEVYALLMNDLLDRGGD